MLQKTISTLADYHCIGRMPMKGILLLLPILTLVIINAFGQINYEKRFEKKTFLLSIETARGPFLLSLRDNEKMTVDTLAYHSQGMAVNYHVHDVWLEDDFLIFVHSQHWLHAAIECANYENGKWIFINFRPSLLSPEEVLQPHEIKIIDRNHIKVTKGGKSYIHTIDYKERKHTVAEETK